MKINVLIDEAHRSAIDKGWWNKERKRTEVLLDVISELTLATRCLEMRANMTVYYESFADNFEKAYEHNILGTFEECIAEAFIKLCDYTGQFSGKYYNIQKNFEKELEGIKNHKIENINEYVFFIIRNVQDIYYTGMSSWAIGESLAKLLHLSTETGFDLAEIIRLRHKYSAKKR